MPRNGSGSYSLPAGNPVSSGTLIEASWANTTLSDIASAVTDSLARSGEGGMTGPLRAADGTVSTPSVSFVSETATGFYRAGATDVRFAMAGVDVATLTTAGVTVGSTKVLALPDGTAAAPALTNTGDTNTGVFFPADNTVAVTTDGTERVRVDASGNVGIGVTPSAWSAGIPAFDIGARGNVYTGSVSTGSAYNAYLGSGGWTYKQTAPASRYEQNQGTHNWYTAPSGTAGNAITFTQAMTLDASGKLFVATTTDNANARVHFAGTTQANNGINLSYGGVGSALIRIADGNALTFGLDTSAGNTERARITSDGNLLVGLNSTVDGYLSTINAAHTGSSVYGLMLKNTSSNNSNAISFINHTNSDIGSIIVSSTATSYVTSSDYRLKENIQPMTGGLAKVAQLKPCTYTWKANGTAGQGFIAHELAEVVPDAVTGEKDAVNEDGSIKAQGIDTSYLVATLTAALQEAHALIKSLEQRVAALEAQS